MATDAEPVRISMCHCLACQRRTGSVFGAQARFARRDVTVGGAAREFERRSDDGERRTYRFCPECGTTVYWTPEDLPEIIPVAIGTFRDPAFPPPRVSVYESRRHAWVGLPPGAEHHG